MAVEVAAPDQPLPRETRGVGIAIQRRQQDVARSLAVAQRVARLPSASCRAFDHEPVDTERGADTRAEPVEVRPAGAHEPRLEILPVVIRPSPGIRLRSLVDDRAVAVE